MKNIETLFSDMVIRDNQSYAFVVTENKDFLLKLISDKSIFYEEELENDNYFLKVDINGYNKLMEVNDNSFGIKNISEQSMNIVLDSLKN